MKDILTDTAFAEYMIAITIELSLWEEVVGVVHYIDADGLLQIGDITVALNDPVFCKKLGNKKGTKIWILKTETGYLFRGL